ncbi:MAG: DHH family phosphoesterase [Clostridiales bacterium]|nr:DHH family phosphoesterase [Clostridiales bacterium]
MKKNNKIMSILLPDNKLFLWIILVLDIAMLYYNLLIGVAGVIALAVLAIYSIVNSREKMKKWTKYIENLSEDLGNAAQSSLISLPIPLSLINLEGKLVWYNSKFSDMFSDKDLLDNEINKFIPQISVEELLKDDSENSEYKIGEKYYYLKKNIINIDAKNKDESVILMLYWIEMTSYVKLKIRYNEERPIMGMIQVDNYDEVINNTKEDKVPFVLSEIESKINLWAARLNGMIKKYQVDKYMIIFENKFLTNIESKRFTILDEIREIDMGNKIPVTLSIGLGVNGKNFDQLEEFSFSALELALARGGDQAVVRKNSNFDFYGGKTKAVEKRNRVKARVIAHALRPLMDESNEIFIMGHKYPDMDAFGAAIGIYRAAINRGKEAYIVLNEVNESIKNVFELFKDDETYKFIKSEDAISRVDAGDMLIVVDTHRPSFTECPELIEKMDRIVLFDHHRRGAEYIENTSLNYVEPYASSTCELIAEVLMYIEDKVFIRDIEAEALLAGIVLDTKSFSLKTGVRTFEAASFLRRYGADTVKVMQLFQDDFETIRTKSDIVAEAEITHDAIAISIYRKPLENIKLIASQSADELLKVRGIDVSFVIGIQPNNEVIISGRSLGEKSVQLILEKLGGGGHLTTAGAQFVDQTIDEVREMLIKEIDEYILKG